MSGLYGVVSNKKYQIENIFNHFYSSFFDKNLKEEYTYKNFIFGRSVINKFLNDRVLYYNDKYIIGFEGIFFNKDDINAYESIIKLYEKLGINFVKNIDGNFSGFILNKLSNKLYIYTDHLSTRSIFYYYNYNKKVFIFSSEMKVISSLLTDLKLDKSIDYDGLYSLLLFGFMIDDITILDGIKKLSNSSIIELDIKTFEIKVFRYYNHIFNSLDINLDEAVRQVDKYLVSAIEREWSKDKEYNYNHYAFLSGGLDSRTNVLIASELGFSKLLTITFSQIRADDYKIAKRIACDFGFENIFYALIEGSYIIKDYYNYILANDGQSIVIGIAHIYSAMARINHYKYGLAHSGQMGDFCFGSWNIKGIDISNNPLRIGYSIYPELNHKISIFKKIIEREKYNNNFEIFVFEQRYLNFIFDGDRAISHFTDMSSPFYYKEFFELCMQLPKKYRYDNLLYIKWLNKKHKHVLKYKWDHCGLKPTSSFKVKYGKNYLKIKNGILNRLGYFSREMHPYNVWVNKNNLLRSKFDRLFSVLIEYFPDNEVKNDINNLYLSNLPYSKYAVISVLLSINLHLWNIDIDDIENEIK